MEVAKQNKKKNLVIYIHGFRASSLAAKAILFQQIFKEDYICPSLPISPKLQFITLDQLIFVFSQFYEQITLIGGGSGGFMATCLLKKYPSLCKAILINPAINCEKTFLKFLGENDDFGGTHFVLSQNHLQEIIDIKQTLDDTLQKQRVLLLLQTGDALLDYKEAIQYLPHAQTHVEQGGDHSFINLESKIDLIRSFIQ